MVVNDARRWRTSRTDAFDALGHIFEGWIFAPDPPVELKRFIGPSQRFESPGEKISHLNGIGRSRVLRLKRLAKGRDGLLGLVSGFQADPYLGHRFERIGGILRG